MSMKVPERLGRLTPREREIYRLRTEGYSKRMIADRLRINFRQVEEHIEQMRNKIGDDFFLGTSGASPREP
jgi:DNA-binding NarL/FixJ family response regulator